MGTKEDINAQNHERLARAKERKRLAHEWADLLYNRDEALANSMYWDAMYTYYHDRIERGKIDGNQAD